MKLSDIAAFDADKLPDRSPTSVLFWIRRLCPYSVFASGAFLGAGGIILCLTPPSSPTKPIGYWMLGLALLILLVAYNLVERDARAWLLLQFVGVASVGGCGLALMRLTALDIWLRLLGIDLHMPALEVLWFLAGLALIGWAVALLVDLGIACLLWQAATLPVAIAVCCWWRSLAAVHLAQQEYPVFGMTIWFVLTGIGLLALLRHERHLIQQAATQPASFSLPKQQPVETPVKYPTRYHELLARGRFCELFKVPCSTPCPLPVTVAAKYQRRRLKYRYYPEVLEAYEKAYAVLITPQSREICRIAHDMMEMKEKQVGMKRFQEIEIVLWGRLWQRLQDSGMRGHAPKDALEKQRLLKEISQDLDE